MVTAHNGVAEADTTRDVGRSETLLKTGALQSAIFNSANFSSIDNTVLARVTQLPNLQRIPVVIVSIVADRNKGFALGTAAVMQKHITAEDHAKLSHQVTTILEKADFDGDRFTAEVRRATSLRKAAA
jgi:hypothetical protein